MEFAAEDKISLNFLNEKMKEIEAGTSHARKEKRGGGSFSNQNSHTQEVIKNGEENTRFSSIKRWAPVSKSKLQ